jgi:hypothetical protein
MWLVAMILLFAFASFRAFTVGVDNRMIAPFIGAILCFFVFKNISNMIRFKEKNQPKP